MSARSHDKARWPLVGTMVMFMAGCAAHQGKSVARNETGCPMSFTLTCDAKRSGATNELAKCRCIRHRDIEEFLHRQ